ncbi:hypothetical protein CROQUDRAFT_98589 [Cronartium quercuum f. sp. fusiforme G11]|uniref:Uncharacterized protein n=1 Tax=Cronartium quercuum f. sp. fusiforme G11 TaxID=708437 RepID=A0A9P6NCB2_9BASI|nr:hypothetical protein CROQUDRAFT_98589 [Cronartium quercuum f. sp. fusiforme G11]
MSNNQRHLADCACHGGISSNKFSQSTSFHIDRWRQINSTRRGQLDRPKTVDCQRPQVVNRLWRVDRPQKDTRMEDHDPFISWSTPFILISTSSQYEIEMWSTSYQHLSSPARSIGARFGLLTAIQACIEGSSGGPVKPKRLLASAHF